MQVGSSPVRLEHAWQTPTASSSWALTVKPSLRASWASASSRRASSSWGSSHVGHGAADLARQVVMMAHERLGQLEAGEVADPREAPYDPLGLEHREVAVHAAQALPRRALDDLVDRERAAGLGQRLDQVAAGAGVAAVVAGESCGDVLVEVGRHPGIISR